MDVKEAIQILFLTGVTPADYEHYLKGDQMGKIYVHYIPRTLNLEINKIIMNHESQSAGKVHCQVCGGLKGKLESCCDDSDNRPIYDSDDVRTWEPDYD